MDMSNTLGLAQVLATRLLRTMVSVPPGVGLPGWMRIQIRILRKLDLSQEQALDLSKR